MNRGGILTSVQRTLNDHVSNHNGGKAMTSGHIASWKQGDDIRTHSKLEAMHLPKRIAVFRSIGVDCTSHESLSPIRAKQTR